MFSSKQHRFTHKGVKFALDLHSLFLYKGVENGEGIWRKTAYVPVSVGTPRKRKLDKERTAFTEKIHNSRGYCYLNISHSCNLECTYCFANGGAYGGPRQLMDKPMSQKAVEWIVQSNKGKQITFNMFGGEPLLNLSAMYEAIDYAKMQCQDRGQKLSIIISTNGTIDLVEVGRRLQSIHYWIAVSIDGGSTIQNFNRPFRNNKESFDLIARNVRNYIDQFGPTKISARATWRRGQSNLIKAVEDLLSLGFKNISIGRATEYSGGSTQQTNDGDVSDFDEIYDAYDALGAWYVKALNDGQQILLQPMSSIMRAVLQSQITRYRCSAGINKWCVVPSGKVYPCHHFVGDKRFSIGDVASKCDSVELSQKVASGKLPLGCKRCWVRHWCFSDKCTYLTAIKKDMRSLDGFCEHMRSFMEMVCYHVANLSDEGRDTLLSV